MEDVADLAAIVQATLLGRNETVGCAESLTGGDLAGQLSAAAGASAVFNGAVVCYATEVKRRLLGVTAELVVSAACAEQMAGAVRDLLGTDWALATTGVAGPQSQEDQPVGTVYVGIAGLSAVRSVLLHLEGDRAAIRAQTCRAALAELLDELA